MRVTICDFIFLTITDGPSDGTKICSQFEKQDTISSFWKPCPAPRAPG